MWVPRFRVMPFAGSKYFTVHYKQWFSWRPAYVLDSSHFDIWYDTKEAALKAIEGYKTKHTEVSDVTRCWY